MPERQFHFLHSFKSNTTDITSGVGTAYHSVTTEFIPGFLSGLCCPFIIFLCNAWYIIVCLFVFFHLTVVLFVFRFMISNYQFVIFTLLFTNLSSSNFYLPICHLQTFLYQFVIFKLLFTNLSSPSFYLPICHLQTFIYQFVIFKLLFTNLSSSSFSLPICHLQTFLYQFVIFKLLFTNLSSSNFSSCDVFIISTFHLTRDLIEDSSSLTQKNSIYRLNCDVVFFHYKLTILIARSDN